MRALGIDPVRDTRDCFRELLDAMSRPGTIAQSPTEPADYAVLATLVDHEISLYTTDEQIQTALENEGRLTPAERTDADVVHAPRPTDGAVSDLRRGSLKEPSDGATIVYRVAGLAAAPDRTEGTRVTLSGPGIPGERRLAVDGLPAAELRALAEAQSAYPRGVDAVLTSTDRIAALPRSVELEVA